MLGISVNSVPSNAAFAKKIGVTFPLLSDFHRKVSKEYGVLNVKQGFANRTTFVINKQGIILHVDHGNAALNPKGAEDACNLMAHEQMEHNKKM